MAANSAALNKSRLSRMQNSRGTGGVNRGSGPSGSASGSQKSDSIGNRLTETAKKSALDRMRFRDENENQLVQKMRGKAAGQALGYAAAALASETVVGAPVAKKIGEKVGKYLGESKVGKWTMWISIGTAALFMMMVVAFVIGIIVLVIIVMQDIVPT